MALQQMRRLATGRGAGIEHACRRRQGQRIGHLLRGAVLHRNIAFGEARQLAHRHGVVQAHRIRQYSIGVRDDIQFGQSCDICRRVGARTLHAQPHRRHLRTCGENGFGTIAPVRAQLLAQPRRPTGIVGHRGKSFALGTPQNRVEHAGLTGPAQCATRIHGGRQRGVRGQLQHLELRETDHQQRLEFGIAGRQRAFQPLPQRDLIRRAPANDRKADRLHQRAITRIADAGQGRGKFGLQRPALIEHRRQYACGSQARGDAGGCGVGRHQRSAGRSRRALR